jgi:hypothetical protein
MNVQTSVEEIEEMRNLSAQTDCFEVWKDEQEDIYPDHLS